MWLLWYFFGSNDQENRRSFQQAATFFDSKYLGQRAAHAHVSSSVNISKIINRKYLEVNVSNCPCCLLLRWNQV